MPNLLFRQGPLKLVCELAIPQRKHVRNRLHTKRLGNSRLLIDIDFHQQKLPRGFGGDPFQNRPQLLARGALWHR